MNRRTSILVVGLLIAALLAVAALASPGSPIHQEPTLGLDLQGGLEVTLQAVPPADRELTEDDLNRSVDIMRNRVDKLGVTEPEIRTQGDDQIVIQLPGVKDPAAAAEIIGTTAQLELYDLETSLTGPSITIDGFPVAHSSLYELLPQVQAQATGDSDAPLLRRQPAAEAGRPRPVQHRAGGAQRRRPGSCPRAASSSRCRRRWSSSRAARARSCAREARREAASRRQKPRTTSSQYDRPSVPQMTGEDLKLDGTTRGLRHEPRRRQPAHRHDGVHRPRCATRSREITREEWTRGKIRNAPQHFAIVLDREIRTFPQIDYTDSSLAGGIGGGRAQIQGLESLDEAQDIAIVLQTGALPVKFETLDRTDISATLGQDSLEEAWKAAIGGLILVALFLLLFYRFLGLVAVAGLAVYAAFLYATILVFDVTLTLPGLRGPRA